MRSFSWSILACAAAQGVRTSLALRMAPDAESVGRSGTPSPLLHEALLEQGVSTRRAGGFIKSLFNCCSRDAVAVRPSVRPAPPQPPVDAEDEDECAICFLGAQELLAEGKRLRKICECSNLICEDCIVGTGTLSGHQLRSGVRSHRCPGCSTGPFGAEGVASDIAEKMTNADFVVIANAFWARGRGLIELPILKGEGGLLQYLAADRGRGNCADPDSSKAKDVGAYIRNTILRDLKDKPALVKLAKLLGDDGLGFLGKHVMTQLERQ